MGTSDVLKRKSKITYFFSSHHTLLFYQHCKSTKQPAKLTLPTFYFISVKRKKKTYKKKALFDMEREKEKENKPHRRKPPPTKQTVDQTK